MTDEDLVKEVVEQNSSGALKELADRHSGIYLEMVKKYLPFSNSSFYLNDFLDEKLSVVYDAAKSYDENRGAKFVTWFGNMTRYACLSERTRLKDEPIKETFEEHMGGETYLSPEKYLDLKDFSEYTLNKIEERFGSKTAKIMENIYFGGPNKTGENLAKTAKRFGVTSQAIQSTRAKVLKFLQNANSIQRPY